ncbi:MAG: hypothetical protein ACYTEQ_30130 [Planctomycetota bacterium]|jgi:hypothetical protein
MKLTPKHKRLIELLANPLDMRTKAEKAKAEDSEVLARIDQRSDELSMGATPEAYSCLIRNLRGGDRASARDFLQARKKIGTGGDVKVYGSGITQTDEEYAERVDRILSPTEETG